MATVIRNHTLVNAEELMEYSPLNKLGIERIIQRSDFIDLASLFQGLIVGKVQILLDGQKAFAAHCLADNVNTKVQLR